MCRPKLYCRSYYFVLSILSLNKNSVYRWLSLFWRSHKTQVESKTIFSFFVIIYMWSLKEQFDGHSSATDGLTSAYIWGRWPTSWKENPTMLRFEGKAQQASSSTPSSETIPQQGFYLLCFFLSGSLISIFILRLEKRSQCWKGWRLLEK